MRVRVSVWPLTCVACLGRYSTALDLAAKQATLLRAAEGRNGVLGGAGDRQIGSGVQGSLLRVNAGSIPSHRSVAYDSVASLFTLSPRWFCDWINKPHRNRCIADFSGFTAELTAMALHPDGMTMGCV